MVYDKEALIDRIILDLGANYQSGDKEVLVELFEEVSSIASNTSNREETDIKLFPCIKKAVKAMYLARGAEGLASLNESGVSSSYNDIIERLSQDIVKNGLRKVK